MATASAMDMVTAEGMAMARDTVMATGDWAMDMALDLDTATMAIIERL